MTKHCALRWLKAEQYSAGNGLHSKGKKRPRKFGIEGICRTRRIIALGTHAIALSLIALTLTVCATNSMRVKHSALRAKRWSLLHHWAQSDRRAMMRAAQAAAMALCSRFTGPRRRCFEHVGASLLVMERSRWQKVWTAKKTRRNNRLRRQKRKKLRKTAKNRRSRIWKTQIPWRTPSEFTMLGRRNCLDFELILLAAPHDTPRMTRGQSGMISPSVVVDVHPLRFASLRRRTYSKPFLN